MFGFNQEGGTVTGVAVLTIEPRKHFNSLEFSDLEQWLGHPGAAGTGQTFGNGVLHYYVETAGRGFHTPHEGPGFSDNSLTEHEIAERGEAAVNQVESLRDGTVEGEQRAASRRWQLINSALNST